MDAPVLVLIPPLAIRPFVSMTIGATLPGYRHNQQGDKPQEELDDGTMRLSGCHYNALSFRPVTGTLWTTRIARSTGLQLADPTIV